MSYQRVARLSVMLSPRKGDTRANLGAPAAVEAAIEITRADGSEHELAGGARELGELLRPLIDVSQAALTVGPTYRIVKPENGAVFLSLSLKRHPDTTIAQFRHWWLTQHAKVATPLLPGLLAYDQVHVDYQLSQRASDAAGLPYVPYDSYDNLTWASAGAFVRSTSDPQAMRTIYEDEVGHIDHATYRGALMDLVA